MLEERPVAIDITAQLAKQLQARGIAHADAVAREISARLSPIYGEEDLRDAFRSGRPEPTRNPGLKRQARKKVHNEIMNSIGSRRHVQQVGRPAYRGRMWKNMNI